MNGMRRLFVWLATASLVVAVTAGTATAKHGGVMCVLNTQLSASNETTGSTSTATGHAQIKVWNDGTIGFKTQIFNPNHETFVAGHVHQAPVGVPGPIVVPLFGGPATTAGHIKLSGPATPNPGTTGTTLCQNPSAYYVNYHTTAFPGGAIRGQLH
jgi:CHRD domain-containing protein